ncbi:MAG: hypothetical protein JXB05_15970 [Myxococcaceae bacterium]|nr:hypothetical protein [Myxococcaceae bacterium]
MEGVAGLDVTIDRLTQQVRQLHLPWKGYGELQRTQSQLIQSEKLASLAHLTSGIAHELKNPLNFINNLSEASLELSLELERTMKEQPQLFLREVQGIIADFKQNATTVHQHGMRADRIIRSMMEHARSRSGAPELHGERMSVESEPGQYTRFTVSLPASDEPQIATAE